MPHYAGCTASIVRAEQRLLIYVTVIVNIVRLPPSGGCAWVMITYRTGLGDSYSSSQCHSIQTHTMGI